MAMMEETNVIRCRIFGCVLALILVATGSRITPAAADTRTVINGLEVHQTGLILDANMPPHLLTEASCTDAQAGWHILPESVKTEVVTARMMDPSGDPDWKVEKAEARTA